MKKRYLLLAIIYLVLGLTSLTISLVDSIQAGVIDPIEYFKLYWGFAIFTVFHGVCAWLFFDSYKKSPK